MAVARHDHGDSDAHPKRWGDALHDDDLAEAIVDRILERGRLLRLDGPSVRTKHLPGDELADDDHNDRKGSKVSGTEAAEFPEPIRAWWELCGRPGPNALVFVDGSSAPLIEFDRRGNPKGPVAARFREHLKLAGMTHSQLFEKSDIRRPVRLHDLRALIVTVALANGRTETWISDAPGIAAPRWSRGTDALRGALRSSASVIYVPSPRPSRSSGPKGTIKAPRSRAKTRTTKLSI